jgi:hypothetical protein
MAREFRLDLKITLPDGDFDEAEALVALKPVVEAFGETLQTARFDMALSYGVVTPKPRGGKGEDA